MGATRIHAYSSGKTVQEAYTKLQKKCRKEKGDDFYNGSFGSCVLREESEYKNAVELYDFYNSDDSINMFKGESYWAVQEEPVLNTNKIKSMVNIFPQYGHRRWVIMYMVKENSTSYEFNDIKEFAYQKDAIAFARDKQSNNPNYSYEIHIIKTITQGNAIVAEIKYKPKTGEKDGKWLFVAYAPV